MPRNLLLPLLALGLAGLVALLLWQPWTDAATIENPGKPEQFPGSESENLTQTPPVADREALNNTESPAKDGDSSTRAKASDRLHRGFTLRGHVYLGDLPLPRATVIAREGILYPGLSNQGPKILAQVTTDDNGAFEVRVTRTPVHLLASSDTGQPADVLAVHTPEDRSKLRLTLFPSRTVHGRVFFPDGKSAAEIPVGLYRSGSWKRRRSAGQPGAGYEPPPLVRANSDANGRFSVVVPELTDWSVRASKKTGKGRGLHASQQIEKPWEKPIELHLKSNAPTGGHLVWGYVVDEVGGFLPEAEVRIGENGNFVPVDKEGVFRFENISAGRKVLLIAAAEERATHLLRLDAIEGDTGPIYLRMQPGASIAGVLLDDENQPIANSRVRIDGDPTISRNSVPPTTLLTTTGNKLGVTDEKGHFEFTGLRDQLYRVTWREEAPPHRFAVAAVRAGTTDLRLRAGTTTGPEVVIEGRVIDEGTNQPIADVFVDVSRDAQLQYGSGSYGVAIAKTDKQGRFEVRGLEAARYALSVAVEGYAPSKTPVRRFEIGKHSIKMLVAEERQITVHVLDLAGSPSKQAKVEVREESGTLLNIKLEGGGRRSPVYADDRGTAILGGLPAHRVTVRALLEWWQPATELDVDLRPKAPEAVTLRMRVRNGGKGQVHVVHLRDSKGQPAQLAAGCSFRVTTENGELLTTGTAAWKEKKLVTTTAKRAVQSAEAGTLRFYGPRSACRLHIDAPGYEPVVVSIPQGSKSQTAELSRR